MDNIATGTVPAVFGNCHEIGHFIGEETYEKTGNLESALAECTSACGYGCIHGAVGMAVANALGEEYNDDNIAHAPFSEIVALGARYCTQTGLCHGMGHILFLNSNNFSKSLNGCDSIASGAFAQACYEGVFMQSIGDLTSALIVGNSQPTQTPLSSSEYAKLCNSLAVSYRHACFLYLPDYLNKDFQKNGTTDVKEEFALAAHTCTNFTGVSRSECFEGLGRSTGPHSVFIVDSQPDAWALCSSLSTESDQQSCVLGRINIMSLFESYGHEADFCALTNGPTQTLCYDAVFQNYYQTHYNANASAVCDMAQDAQSCQTELNAYMQIYKTLPDYRYGLLGKI